MLTKKTNKAQESVDEKWKKYETMSKDIKTEN